MQDGRAIDVPATAASALNAGRQLEGLEPIPSMSMPESQALQAQLAKRAARHDNGDDLP